MNCQTNFAQNFEKSTVFYPVLCALFYIENDAEIFPEHFTWKVAEKGFKVAFMMNKLAMIYSCEIILEKQNNFLCLKSLWNLDAHYTCMHIILEKMW